MKTVRIVMVLVALCSVSVAAFGDWQAGVDAFKKKDYATAIAEFKQVVADQPEYAGGHLMLGQSLLANKQASQAVAPLQKALELNSGDVGTQLALGSAFYQSGKHKDAVATLGKINTSSLPAANQAQVLQMLAGARLKSGDFANGAKDLESYAKLKDDGKSWSSAAKAYLSAGETNKAVSSYEKAMAKSDDPSIKREYINVLKRQGRETRDSAAKAAVYKKAESAARSLASDGSYDSLLLLGEVQLGAKNYSAAATTLTQASSKKPSDWLAHFYLGQVYTAMGKNVEAVEPLTRALAATSSADDQKNIYRQLGFAYEKQKKYAESIAAYEKAGDAGGVARVRENENVAKHNAQADQHNQQIEELEKQQEELKKALEQLPGEAPPRR